MQYNNLSNHLNNQIAANNYEQIDESLILGAIVATTCLTYAVTPVLNTEFMKSVGQGLGGLLGTIGGLFGGKGISLSKRNNISELLQKNPDDLTGKEKEQLRKLANDKKLRNDLSNNELKALNKALGKSATDLDNVEDNTDAKNTKDKNKDTSKTDENKSPISGITEALLAFANLANKNEKDEAKKAENDALIDIISASCYDENGNEIPADKRAAKMKELVGDDNWESFKKDLEDKQKSVNEDEFKEALEKASKDIKAEDVDKMKKEQKDRAKAAGERIKKENEEKAKVNEELKKLNEDPNADKKKIEELQKKKEDLIKSSTLGKASPNTAKSAIERISKVEEPKEPKKEEPKEPKKEEPKEPKKEEPKKDKDGNIIKKEKVEDPKTGEKITVTTHTGPRGGKYYMSKQGNKVYVKENKYSSLSSYLLEKL